MTKDRNNHSITTAWPHDKSKSDLAILKKQIKSPEINKLTTDFYMNFESAVCGDLEKKITLTPKNIIKKWHFD